MPSRCGGRRRFGDLNSCECDPREAHRRAAAHVAGFAERNPLLAPSAAAERGNGSLLHVVYREDGACAASRLDARVAHVEVALL